MAPLMWFEGVYANYHHPGLRRVSGGQPEPIWHQILEQTGQLGKPGKPRQNQANQTCSRRVDTLPHMATYGPYMVIHGHT